MQIVYNYADDHDKANILFQRLIDFIESHYCIHEIKYNREVSDELRSEVKYRNQYSDEISLLQLGYIISIYIQKSIAIAISTDKYALMQREILARCQEFLEKVLMVEPYDCPDQDFPAVDF